MKYCKCHSTLTLKECFNGLVEEVGEFIQTPTKDEASDIVYVINRTIGSVFRRPYVSIIPGDEVHKEKIAKRMEKYGCIRSERHLILGQCPTEFRENEAKNKG